MSTRKRSNKYFANHNDHKKRKQFVIEPGMTGFLCTCNFHERGCITDAYKLLNQFDNEVSSLEKIKESEVSSTSSTFDNKKTNKFSEDIDENEDISTALQKEINELRTECEMPLPLRKFQVVDTGVKNMIFVKSTVSNPLELVTKILIELDATKKQCTRFLLRLLPIEVICKAYMDDIRIKAGVLFEKYFSQEPKTFSIVFNRHSNNSIKRDEIIEDLAEIILRKNPGNKTDLKNPEIAVVVEVIRGLCLLSIAPNYYKFKKYNLFEICNSAKNKIISSEEIAKASNEKNIKSNEKNSKEYSNIIISSIQEVKQSINENKT